MPTPKTLAEYATQAKVDLGLQNVNNTADANKPVSGPQQAALDALQQAIDAIPAGQNGDAGASAYQIALLNGFVGTELEWLDSLKGVDGTNGTNGVDGIDGINGTNGVDGADGSDAVWTQITQAAYDALSPPDPNTLYVIVG